MNKISGSSRFKRLVSTNTTSFQNSSSVCISFFSDHPDAGCSKIIVSNSSANGGKKQQTLGKGNDKTQFLTCNGDIRHFCTYFHPDHPEAGRNKSIRGNYTTNNSGTVKHQSMTSSHNKTHRSLLPTCEESSSLCTYFYHSNTDIGRKKKTSNYTPMVTVNVNDMLEPSNVNVCKYYLALYALSFLLMIFILLCINVGFQNAPNDIYYPINNGKVNR